MKLHSLINMIKYNLDVKWKFHLQFLVPFHRLIGYISMLYVEMKPANDLTLKNLSIFPTISGSKCLEF